MKSSTKTSITDTDAVFLSFLSIRFHVVVSIGLCLYLQAVRLSLSNSCQSLPASGSPYNAFSSCTRSEPSFWKKFFAEGSAITNYLAIDGLILIRCF